MSVGGPTPLDASVVGALSAAQVAARARIREKEPAPASRRFQDLVELRVNGLETLQAVRALPQNDSEQAQTEHQASGGDQRHSHGPTPIVRPSVDLKA